MVGGSATALSVGRDWSSTRRTYADNTILSKKTKTHADQTQGDLNLPESALVITLQGRPS
jgi:hypothetical protein